ncbi:MAG TPA: universal stress protein [bacterium]|nr:universal stress protein [bacterium]
MIQLCPRPILATPQTMSPLKRALLAYDGSPKSEEALFVATYISGQWQIPLDVVTVLENENDASKNLDKAQIYLEAHGVVADYITREGPVAKTILNICEYIGADLLIMGGYGSNPLVEVVLGSVVDQVLRECHTPTLICR